MGLRPKATLELWMSVQDTEIVIIGAGAAGCGAARRLVAAGYTPLLVEALPRAGGRAWTAHAAGMPLDLGCAYLHSADRNPWTEIALQTGFEVDRRPPAWNRQYKNLGADGTEWDAATEAFERWSRRLHSQPPGSDVAADALDPKCRFNAYIQVLSGYISGDELERISATDYLAYDLASTYCNWRLPGGYGTLVTTSLPAQAILRLETPVEKITLDEHRLVLHTPAGALRPRAAIVTVSTNVLANGRLALPSALDSWRDAAARLPLGDDEKLFFEITDPTAFEPETHVMGDLHDPETGSFYLRPFGRPVVECFLGGAGARRMAKAGPEAAFARAFDQLAALFGHNVRSALRPLVTSNWRNTSAIGGAYSHALPGQAEARAKLALPYEDRLFFAGEATHRTDFSTAHGAYLSGLRAADEALAALRTD
jgi:monoamine oxidase